MEIKENKVTEQNFKVARAAHLARTKRRAYEISKGPFWRPDTLKRREEVESFEAAAFFQELKKAGATDEQAHDRTKKRYLVWQ